MGHPKSFLSIAVSIFPLALFAGCSASFAPSTTQTAQTAMPAISGRVHGGRQPISQAKVFLLESGVTGNAGPGIAPYSGNSSKFLALSGAPTDTGTGNTNGQNYVLTNATGDFSITGDYTCDAGRFVYIYEYGGEPDGTNENDSASNMAPLGICPSGGTFSSSLFIYINEVSTVAMAYALEGYASDATHISNSGTSLATTGFSNAVANIAQLYDVSAVTNGSSATSALATTPNGLGTVPQALLNSIANTLASCVNSPGTGQGTCGTLFADTVSNGIKGGITPSDTASSAIYIAQNPSQNVTTLFQLPSPTGYPYSPNLGPNTPNDFTVAISFPALPSSDGNNGQSPVIDADGNVWYVNSFVSPAGNVLRYSPLGVPTTFTNSINSPNWLAFATSNAGWVTNSGGGTNGTIVIGPDQAIPAVITPNVPNESSPAQFLVFDGAGQAWVNYGQDPVVSIYTAAGTPADPPFTLHGIDVYILPHPDHSGHINAYGISVSSGVTFYLTQTSFAAGALQLSNLALPTAYSYQGDFLAGGSNDHIWAYSYDTSSKIYLQEFDNSANLLHTYSAPSALTSSFTPVMDGSGNIFTMDGTYLTEQDNLGNVLSPTANGYQFGSANLDSPGAAAVDGSGDLWVLNSTPINSTQSQLNFVEFIGLATPAITPISANNPANAGLTGLGVRP